MGDHVKNFIKSEDLNNASVKVEYISEDITVCGKKCMTVRPDISMNPPEGCSNYHFDKQLLQDITAHLIIQDESMPTSSATATSSESAACKICKKKKIPLKTFPILKVTAYTYTCIFTPTKKLGREATRYTPCQNKITTFPLCNVCSYQSRK